jgi:hypothetical protein
MKRSQVNGLLRQAQEFFDTSRFRLPPWAAWTPDQWRSRRTEAAEVIENQLGWDLTDFGSGRYASRGLLLFTLRNGKPGRPGKTYAEKIMMVGVDQETPAHFHFAKQEDIINRGGGDLVVQLWNSSPEQGLADTEVEVRVDGLLRRLPAGGEVVLSPGESVCLPTRLYHRFFGAGETVLVGEVSQVNDDHTDNRFLEPLGRFPQIEEDEEPWRLLVSDYARL